MAKSLVVANEEKAAITAEKDAGEYYNKCYVVVRLVYTKLYTDIYLSFNSC